MSGVRWREGEVSGGRVYVVKLYMYMYSNCACVGEESARGKHTGGCFLVQVFV